MGGEGGVAARWIMDKAVMLLRRCEGEHGGFVPKRVLFPVCQTEDQMMSRVLMV